MGEHTRLVTCVCLLIVGGLAVGTAAVSAATAGGVDQGGVLYSHTNGEYTGVDEHLVSGGLYWQGQSVRFDNTNGTVDSEQLLLREYDTNNNEVGTLVREIEFDGNGTELETEDLDGTYVLVPTDRRGEAVVFENGTASRTVGIRNATPFEVLQQSLTVRWEGGRSGTVNSEREVELASNRVRYNVNVSSPSLSFKQLEQVFMGDRILRNANAPFGDRAPFEQRYGMYDAYAEEDIIVLRGFSDGSLESDFSQIETLPGAFTVEVTDTGVTETAELPTNAAETGPFTITQLNVEENPEPGEQISLSATVTNEWSTTESRDIVFEVGETRSSVETTLESGAETTVSTTLAAPMEAGEVDYVVSTDGDRVEGTVTVGDPMAEQDESDESAESDEGIVDTAIGLLYPQALIGTVMTVLSLVGFILWRRR